MRIGIFCCALAGLGKSKTVAVRRIANHFIGNWTNIADMKFEVFFAKKISSSLCLVFLIMGRIFKSY